MDEGEGLAREHVRFALFGGVRAIREGVTIEVTQPKQRAILALLLARPGEPVPIAELVDTLWPRDPAASVANQIHRHVGALRRICEPQLPRRQVGRYVVPAGTGYRLVVGAQDCDVLQFRGLVRHAQQLDKAGDREPALRTYLQALAVAAAPAGDDRLWSLPVFVGLEDERVGAVVTAAELCRTAEEHALLLPALRAAAGRHLLDEALQARLMTALTRTGRAGEALAVHAAARRRLREELGSSPGNALRDAQAEALRGEPTPRRSSRTALPAQLPSPLAAFAGRREVLASLLDPGESRPRVLLVTGMAGVGKTTLALRYAAEVAPDYPDGQLYVNLRGFDATATPLDPLEALRDLLEGLGIPAQGQPDSLGARAGLLRTMLTDRRILILLDNVHDYRQVEPLLPGAGACSAVVTSRNQLPGLAAFQQARVVPLEPFADDEVIEFLHLRLPTRSAGDDEPAMSRLGRACGGLPLALAIVAARAAANPQFPLDLLTREFAQEQGPLSALSAGSADLDLSTVFSWSQRGLSPDAARTFALLSVHPGPEISAAAAVSLADLAPLRAREVLTELATASVLRETRPGRYGLHDLVRRHARELLGDAADLASARLIAHYVASARAAIESFGQLSVSGADQPIPGVLAEAFADSSAAVRWYREERSVLHAVCRLAADLDDHRSALQLMLDWRPMSQAVDARHDMLPFADLAIRCAERVEDPALQGEAYRDAASNLARTGRHDLARAYFERSAAAFRQAGDHLGDSNLLRSMALTLTMDPDDRIALLRDSLALARRLDDPATLAAALQGVGLGLLWGGRFDDATEAFTECLALIGADARLTHLEPHVLSGRSRALAGAGRLAESSAAAVRALDLLRREGAADAELRLLHSHGEVLTALGRRHEAAEAWQRYLTLATSPELVRETVEPDEGADGSATIARIRTKLSALTTPPDRTP